MSRTVLPEKIIRAVSAELKSLLAEALTVPENARKSETVVAKQIRVSQQLVNNFVRWGTVGPTLAEAVAAYRLTTPEGLARRFENVKDSILDLISDVPPAYSAAIRWGDEAGLEREVLEHCAAAKTNLPAIKYVEAIKLLLELNDEFHKDKEKWSTPGRALPKSFTALKDHDPTSPGGKR